MFESLEHKVLNKFYRLNLKKIRQNEIAYIHRYDKKDLKIYFGEKLKENYGKQQLLFKITHNSELFRIQLYI